MPKFKESEIVEQWGTLIEGAQGKQQDFYKAIRERLNELQPPKLDISQEKICASLLRQLKGESRMFLVLKSKYFDGYVVRVGAEDYGKQLNISWYMTQTPSKFIQFLLGLPSLVFLLLYPVYIAVIIYEKAVKKRVSLENMDLFDKDEFSAFAGTVHHSVLYGSRYISEAVGFDFSKVDQKSRGFLNLN
ncbi:MAG: hypothetical protein WC926_01825 [Candidatus Paceibacterota bacterium]|jgi:hypothetical protein